MQKHIMRTWQKSKMCHLKRFTSLTLLLTLIGFAASEDDYKVPLGECSNAANYTVVVNICCQPVDVSDEAANTCLQMQRTYPEDKLEKLKKVSSVVGCIYRKKKYIKSNTQLNMGAIKAQAKKLYKNDTVKKDFMINMYRFCARTATTMLNQLKRTTQGQQFIKETRQPFFLFVFLCGLDYSKAKCPFNRWEGTNVENSKKCANYVHQCEKYFKSQTVDIKGSDG